MPESDPISDADAGAPGEAMVQRAKRDSLFLLTDFVREDGEVLGRGRVRNLSATGLMADCEYMLSKGDRIIVALRGVGRVMGRVVWTHGTKIGVAFDQEIDPQLARKPVQDAPADDMPVYLRHLNRAQRFTG